MSYRNSLTLNVLRALTGLAVSALPALGGTLLVPQTYPTLQAAINAAAPNDVIIVSPGTYSGPGNRDLNLLGKPITLRSANGAATCIIDASDPVTQAHCGFAFQGGETTATVIDGFTVTGGYQFNGGGMYFYNGSPTVMNCIITGNTVGCWGGGVYVEGTAAPRIFNCLITNNDSSDDGGGFFSLSGSARVENCIITNNNASVGAGVCVFGGQTLFVNCRITGNTASTYGGGVFLSAGRLVNCTVANNSAVYAGGGMYNYGSSSVANSIIWGNTGPSQAYGGGPVSYSIVQGGLAGVGNSASNPLFLNPAAGDFRVSTLSPAIDAGSNVQVPAGVVTDLAGSVRFYSNTGVPVVDIGAFEVRPLKQPFAIRPQ